MRTFGTKVADVPLIEILPQCTEQIATRNLESWVGMPPGFHHLSLDELGKRVVFSSAGLLGAGAIRLLSESPPVERGEIARSAINLSVRIANEFGALGFESRLRNREGYVAGFMIDSSAPQLPTELAGTHTSMMYTGHIVQVGANGSILVTKFPRSYEQTAALIGLNSKAKDCQYRSEPSLLRTAIVDQGIRIDPVEFVEFLAANPSLILLNKAGRDGQNFADHSLERTYPRQSQALRMPERPELEL